MFISNIKNDKYLALRLQLIQWAFKLVCIYLQFINIINIKSRRKNMFKHP